MRPRLSFLLGLLALGLPMAARAQALDLSQGGPIAITAKDGLEWRQAQQEVIAMGDAKAVRQNVTVTADQLIAFYRKKDAAPGTAQSGTGQPGTGQKAAPPAATPASADGNANPAAASPGDTEGTEIYRLEAIGHVQVFTATDHAQGDRAVYDMDQAVLVLTGHDLRLTTPNQVLTARDSLEYWPQEHMAVARGHAVVVTKDARRISADVLVAYTTAADTPPATTPGKPGTTAAAPAPSNGPPADPLAASGKLREVQAFGNVSIRTPTDTVTGDRGVYVPATGLARLAGHVHITRGQNQLNGEEAEVDLKSGVSRLIAGQNARVHGLVIPNGAPAGANLTTPPGTTAPGGTAPAAKPKPSRPPGSPAASGDHS